MDWPAFLSGERLHCVSLNKCNAKAGERMEINLLISPRTCSFVFSADTVSTGRQGSLRLTLIWSSSSPFFNNLSIRSRKQRTDVPTQTHSTVVGCAHNHKTPLLWRQINDLFSRRCAYFDSVGALIFGGLPRSFSSSPSLHSNHSTKWIIHTLYSIPAQV